MAIKATGFPMNVDLFTCCGTEFTQPTLNLENTIINGNGDLGEVLRGYPKVPRGYQKIPRGYREGQRGNGEVPRGTKGY